MQVLLAEQKAARDARYAARKAAKKERRRGTEPLRFLPLI